MSHFAERLLGLAQAVQVLATSARNLVLLPIGSTDAHAAENKIDKSLETIEREASLILGNAEPLPATNPMTDRTEWEYEVRHGIPKLVEMCREVKRIAMEGQKAMENQLRPEMHRKNLASEEPEHWANIQRATFEITNDINQRAERLHALRAAIDEQNRPTVKLSIMTPAERGSMMAAWDAEWRATLSPDTLDRMCELAQECASERYWNERRETFKALRAATGTADEVLARRFHSFASFPDLELSHLLAEHHPELLIDFGPRPEFDDSCTSKERAERCHTVYAKLLAMRNTRDAEVGEQRLPMAPAPEFEYSRRSGMFSVRGFGEQGYFSADLIGFQQIAMLLKAEGDGVPMIQLIACGEVSDNRVSMDSRRSRQPVFDDATLRENGEKLKQLIDARGYAEENGLTDEHSNLTKQIEALTQLLNAAITKTGKAKDLNNVLNKLRPRIYNTLKTAYQKLRDATPAMPKLAEHFKRSITSKAPCFMYRAPSNLGIKWHL